MFIFKAIGIKVAGKGILPAYYVTDDYGNLIHMKWFKYWTLWQWYIGNHQSPSNQ